MKKFFNVVAYLSFGLVVYVMLGFPFALPYKTVGFEVPCNNEPYLLDNGDMVFTPPSNMKTCYAFTAERPVLRRVGAKPTFRASLSTIPTSEN